MKTISYDVYEADDAILRALELGPFVCDASVSDEESYCPRCRLSRAVTQLTSEYELPFDWGDGMLMMLTLGLPVGPMNKHDSDSVLNELLEKRRDQ